MAVRLSAALAPLGWIVQIGASRARPRRAAPQGSKPMTHDFRICMARPARAMPAPSLRGAAIASGVRQAGGAA